MEIVNTLRTKPAFANGVIYITHPMNRNVLPMGHGLNTHLVIVTDEMTSKFWRGNFSTDRFRSELDFDRIPYYTAYQVFPRIAVSKGLPSTHNYQYDPDKLVAFVENLRGNQLNVLISLKLHYELEKIHWYFNKWATDYKYSN